VKGVSLTIEKKELGVWIEIPCIEGIGSCDYTGADLCTKLAGVHPDVQAILKHYGIPDTCPIHTATYNVPASDAINVHIKDPGLSWLTSGDLYFKAMIYNTAGTEDGCVEAYVSIS